MGIMKRLMEEGYSVNPHGGISPREAFKIGKANSFIGRQVRVTWLKPWGKKPIGHTITGSLKATFVVGGRTLIGEVEIPALIGGTKTESCPWSKNYISVEITD